MKSANEITLTLLGTGTSTGVPLIGCRCSVCRSKNVKNHRLRASAWWQVNGKSILIDTSTDLRQQALRYRISRVDAVLYTHPHADHILGIDELRSFNYIQKERITLYGNAWTAETLKTAFPYIFKPRKIEGGGIPLLDFQEIRSETPSIPICGIPVTPISLRHGSQECLAYRVGPIAYVTDCNSIPETSMERLRDLDTLILDCVRIKPHDTHFNLEKALQMAQELKPRKTYLTHLGHDFDFVIWQKKLPRGVRLAYDGLRVSA